ncbi:hypothetical protein [Sphingobium sp. CFD-2]|uniref:hypothetical protein n=1 Tax=Sphingobium sp. CFD-2 TaxID=2878542 RepID=UPI00214BF570|nr:hypothetical protein [Sphingobium sp. CFD-2]
MKRISPLCLLLALSACGGITNAVNGIPASPTTVANSTTLDEQGVLAAELAYKAARVAVETGVDAGLIKGPTAAKVAQLDRRAFAALGVVRKAYAAGNAASYASALTRARAAIADLLTLTGKTGA